MQWGGTGLALRMPETINLKWKPCMEGWSPLDAVQKKQQQLVTSVQQTLNQVPVIHFILNTRHSLLKILPLGAYAASHLLTAHSLNYFPGFSDLLELQFCVQGHWKIDTAFLTSSKVFNRVVCCREEMISSDTIKKDSMAKKMVFILPRNKLRSKYCINSILVCLV